MSRGVLPLTAEYEGEIGVAREDITPPPGIYARNWGASAFDVAAGVHRPLTATALVIGSGPAPELVWVAADLGWWRSREDEWLVRGALIQGWGLREDQVLVSLSHTHAGPSVSRADAARSGGDLVPGYLETLRRRLLAAVRAAWDDRRPSRLSWRYGRCDLARNRDLPEPGAKRFVVGFNPLLPADDTVLVGRVVELAHRATRAVLVNYACHPTTLAWDNRLISPDYPGAMRELVEAATGGLCFFCQGASGELAPAHQYVGEAAVADGHGRRLGHAVLATLEAWTEPTLAFERVVESGAALAVHRAEPARAAGEVSARRREVELTLKPLPQITEIDQAIRASTDRAVTERLWRKRAVREMVGEGLTMRAPFWVWRIGEAFVVGGPAEAYSHLQVELRRRYPGRPIAILNLTNGGVGYLPPRSHFDRDQYTVWQTPFVAGSLEALVEAASAGIAELLGQAPPIPE